MGRAGGAWRAAPGLLGGRGTFVPAGAGLAVLRLIPWDIGTPWIQLLSLFPASVVVTAAAAALPLSWHSAWIPGPAGRSLPRR